MEKFFLCWIAIGMWITISWNESVKAVCGRPIPFAGEVFGPLLGPILLLALLAEPRCDNTTK